MMVRALELGLTEAGSVVHVNVIPSFIHSSSMQSMKVSLLEVLHKASMQSSVQKIDGSVRGLGH